MSALIKKTYDGPEGKKFKCLVEANQVNEQIHLDVKITSENNETIAELKLQGTASNPFIIAGTVLTAVGYYGLCVGFGIAGAVFKVADEAYQKSKTANPNGTAFGHLQSGFNALWANQVALDGEAKKALISCGQKLVPLPTGR